MEKDKLKNLSLGTNQSGGRIYNERLVLSLVRHHDGLPKSEIARLTGLSAQTISVIMKQLEADNLIVKGEPIRGKRGQPSVPIFLNPEGCYSIGLKIGRHSSELVMMDFVGNMQKVHQITYIYPETTSLLVFVANKVPELIESLEEHLRDRIVGIGIATPFELWSWGEEVGAPKEVLDAWKEFSVRKEIGRAAELPTFLLNDATAACAAELTFGNSKLLDHFLYIYIGYFIGGGIVLNGSVFSGPSNNAGMLGSLPIRVESEVGSSGRSHQLIKNASKNSLQRMVESADLDVSVIWDKEGDWSVLGKTLDSWIEGLTEDLAFAIVSAISIIDFPVIVVDGDLPKNVRSRIVQSVLKKLEKIDQQGLSSVTVIEGSLGRYARLTGAASLPLLANFSRDRDLAFGGF